VHKALSLHLDSTEEWREGREECEGTDDAGFSDLNILEWNRTVKGQLNRELAWSDSISKDSPGAVLRTMGRRHE
jgi:hypothetical protein